jgi:hypothetical protein
VPRADPAARRDYELHRRYGLPEGEYAKMLEAQGGRCAICGNRPRTQALALDHDHRTGRIRGLLCANCNRGIGKLEYSPEVADRASKYLATIAEDLRTGPLLTRPPRQKGTQTK